MSFLAKIFGDADARLISSLRQQAEKISSLEDSLSTLSSSQLKDKTKELKTRIERGDSLDDILPEAFALVREAAKRTLGQRHSFPSY